MENFKGYQLEKTIQKKLNNEEISSLFLILFIIIY